MAMEPPPGGTPGEGLKTAASADPVVTNAGTSEGPAKPIVPAFEPPECEIPLIRNRIGSVVGEIDTVEPPPKLEHAVRNAIQALTTSIEMGESDIPGAAGTKKTAAGPPSAASHGKASIAKRSAKAGAHAGRRHKKAPMLKAPEAKRLPDVNSSDSSKESAAVNSASSTSSSA